MCAGTTLMKMAFCSSSVVRIEELHVTEELRGAAITEWAKSN